MGAPKEYLKKTNSRYNKRIAEFGNDVRSLDWASKQSQLTRFKNVAKIVPPWDICGKHVLDVGCGLGDFYEYLRKYEVIYTGVDINENLIKQCNENYPDVTAKEATFRVADVLEWPDTEVCDYAFMIDVLDTKFDGSWELMREMVLKLFKLSRRAVGLSMLSDFAPDHIKDDSPEQYYVNPVEMLDFCRLITPWIQINHSFLPHCFSVFLYREQVTDGERK